MSQDPESTIPPENTNPLAGNSAAADDEEELDYKSTRMAVQPYNTNNGCHKAYAHSHEKCDAAKMTATQFDEEVKKIFQSDSFCFSGSMDSQLSADVYDLSKGFPKLNKKAPEVQSGGACTNSMIAALNEHPDLSYGDLLCATRAILKQKGYSQIPQLSVSRQMNLREKKFTVNNPYDTEGKGKKRALIIGINYFGTDGELNGCVNDAKAWKKYLASQGWDVENPEVCRVITDDPTFTTDGMMPTAANIYAGMKWLVEGVKSEDALWFSYSGHGVQKSTFDDSEEDGYDEAIAPVDFEDAGFIRDENMFKTIVAPLPPQCHFVAICDCCHSGSLFDFVYTFTATEENIKKYEKGEVQQMYASAIFSFKNTRDMIADAASGAFDGMKDIAKSAYRRFCCCC